MTTINLLEFFLNLTVPDPLVDLTVIFEEKSFFPY